MRDNTNITNNSISCLTNLTNLDLQHNSAVTDGSVAKLIKLKTIIKSGYSPVTMSTLLMLPNFMGIHTDKYNI